MQSAGEGKGCWAYMEADDAEACLKGPWSQDEDRILTALVQVPAQAVRSDPAGPPSRLCQPAPRWRAAAVGAQWKTRSSVLQAQGPRCWSALARQMPAKEGKRRSGKSCRLRWCNQLDPAVNKASFSQWEMAVIIRAQAVPPTT